MNPTPAQVNIYGPGQHARQAVTKAKFSSMPADTRAARVQLDNLGEFGALGLCFQGVLGGWGGMKDAGVEGGADAHR
jgi:hypothetical protein